MSGLEECKCTDETVVVDVKVCVSGCVNLGGLSDAPSQIFLESLHLRHLSKLGLA